MKPVDLHRAWAPALGRWSPWVKPVLFAAMQADETVVRNGLEAQSLAPAPEWIEADLLAPLEGSSRGAPYRADEAGEGAARTALVIDLPGEAGAIVGVALAGHGFRPIPLYNALPSAVAIVDMEPILRVLVDGADRVATMARNADPPAFLLDSRRQGTDRGHVLAGFDNRSMCRDADFPSVETLLQAGIRRVVWIGETLEPDLEPILLGWQSRGVALWRKQPSRPGPAAPFVLRRRWLGARILAAMRQRVIHAREDGAYGTMIVVPSAS
jgi:hypothetical protein